MGCASSKKQLDEEALEPTDVDGIKAEGVTASMSSQDSEGKKEKRLSVRYSAKDSSGRTSSRRRSSAPFDKNRIGVFTKHGLRPGPRGGGVAKINQDRGVVCWPYNDSFNEALLCIFDGHGEHGERVAGWASDEVAGRLEARRTQLHTDPLRCLSETVVAMDQALLGHPELGGIAHTAGTTASLLYLRGDSLHVACTGDSRAVMGRVNGGKIVAVDLSTDHRPDLPDEKARALTLKLNRTRNANRPPPTPAGREGTGPGLDLNLDLNPCPATDRAGGRLRLGG